MNRKTLLHAVFVFRQTLILQKLSEDDGIFWSIKRKPNVENRKELAKERSSEGFS